MTLFILVVEIQVMVETVMPAAVVVTVVVVVADGIDNDANYVSSFR